MATTIPRPDPVPTCLHCRADAVGQYEGSVLAPGPRPLCEAHRTPAPDWHYYEAAAAPAPVEPAQQPPPAGEVQARLIEEARNAGYDEGFRSGREQGQRDERAHSIKVIADLRDHLRRMALKASADAEKYEALAREARELERFRLAAANALVDAGTRLGDGEAT